MFARTQFTKRNWLIGILAMLIALIASFLVTNNVGAELNDTRPNIVIFLADDAGFSDFVAGEVDTPNFDTLAAEGVMLTQFRAMPTCSPTRAVLLTGVDNHLNGLGSMQGRINAPGNPQKGNFGYEGYMNMNVLSIATLLRDSGYRTYHVGKWHLGVEEEVERGQVVFPVSWWPTDRGFQWGAGMLEGGGEHWGSCERAEGHCTRFYEKNPGDTDPQLVIEQLAPDYFSAKYHTDKAIEFMETGWVLDAVNGYRQPFFLYYADTLVHEPNQVPAEYIDSDLFDEFMNKGPDVLRFERLAELETKGIIDDSVTLPARHSFIPDWNDESDPNWSSGTLGNTLLPFMSSSTYGHIFGGDVTTINDVKEIQAQKFVVYVGMIKYFDDEVGRIMQTLRDNGEYDNTVFIHFNDNGGDSRPWDYIDRNTLSRKGTDNTVENMGLKNSFVANGHQWAQVTNTPLDQAKATVGDGGIRSPLVINDARTSTNAGSMSTSFATVQDIVPTILDYAGVAHPVGVGISPDPANCAGTYGARTNICPVNGKSLLPILADPTAKVHQDSPVGWELFGQTNHAMFLEEADTLWKIRKVGNADWRTAATAWEQPFSLYNLTDDPSESNDLAASNPEKLAEMIGMYQTYLGNVGYVARWTSGAATFDRAITADSIEAGQTATTSMSYTNNTGAIDTITATCMSGWECEVTLDATFRDARGTDIETAILTAGETVVVNLAVTAPANANTEDRAATQLFINSENAPSMAHHLTFVTPVENDPLALSMSTFGSVLDSNRAAIFLVVAVLLFVTTAARAWNVRLSVEPRQK